MTISLSMLARLFSVLVLLAAISFSLKAQNNNQDENVILYNGNAFYWTDGITDTMQIVDPETGEGVYKISHWDYVIARMNQETIYNGNEKEAIAPIFQYNKQCPQEYLQYLFKTNRVYHEIPSFTIQKMVINKNGKPIFFEIDFDDASNNKALRNKWGSLIENAIKAMPYWKPGTYKGIPAPFFIFGQIHINESN